MAVARSKRPRTTEKRILIDLSSPATKEYSCPQGKGGIDVKYEMVCVTFVCSTTVNVRYTSNN